jgi:hypothetical protein
MGIFATLSINDTQNNDLPTFCTMTLSIECGYVESRDYLNAVLSVVLLNVVMECRCAECRYAECRGEVPNTACVFGFVCILNQYKSVPIIAWREMESVSILFLFCVYSLGIQLDITRA